MRRIGTLANESTARKFCDYMVTQSIDATANPEGDEPESEWNVWVRDEKDVERARAEFKEFEQTPQDGRYEVKEQADRIREERVSEHLQRREQQRERSNRNQTQYDGVGPSLRTVAKQDKIPVTIGIILISVVASLATQFGKFTPAPTRADATLSEKIFSTLSFVDFREYHATNDSFGAVRKGEVWRFVTPMFLHGDMLHLTFNMLWIYFLGSVIERLHGSWFLLLIALATQLSGMMLQVMLPDSDTIPEAFRGSPLAIGASGAVYGLLGYLWIRPIVDPRYPIRMVPMNIALMLGWMFACMTPLVDNVANGGHVGGLLGGILLALVANAIPR